MLDTWLEPVLRQCILYSLPVVVSISIVGMVQREHQNLAVFHAFRWHGSYLPLIVGVFLQRGVLIALPRMHQASISQAAQQVLTHAVLCAIGYLLYQWSVPSVSSYGLPPLHHWWAKVLMFYNLCMVLLHLLPLPNLLLGEILLRYIPNYAPVCRQYGLSVLCVCVALTIIDISIGTWFIYPVYEQMANLPFRS